jgi:hypothetical protein
MIRFALALACAATLAACTNQSSPTTAAAVAPIGPSDLRVIDRAILPLVQQPVKETRKDVFPEASYYVMLQPDPSGTYAKVTIDLDRDKNPDEKWIVESGDSIMRMVSPTDDGVNYEPNPLWLRNGVWTREP